MKRIILASTSPRRKEILSKFRLPFEAVASDYEEDMTLPLHPLELAKFLSKGKALAVAEKYHDHLIISADTFVTLGEKIFGKPKTPEQASKMLREISGQVLDVITGITIIETPSQKIISEASVTKVHIKELSDSEIKNYVASGEPLDKAGAFGIQELGAVIVKKIDGDFFTVMGLPLFALSEQLKKFEIKIL